MSDESGGGNSRDMKSLVKGKSAASDLLKPKPKEPERRSYGGGYYGGGGYSGSAYTDPWWREEPGFLSARTSRGHYDEAPLDGRDRHGRELNDRVDDLYPAGHDPLDGPVRLDSNSMELTYKEFQAIVSGAVTAAIDSLESSNVKITATQMALLRGTIERAVKAGQFMTADGDLMNIRVR